MGSWIWVWVWDPASCPWIGFQHFRHQHAPAAERCDLPQTSGRELWNDTPCTPKGRSGGRVETSQEAQTELDQLARPHGNAGNEVSNDTRRLLCRRDDLKQDVIPLKASAATVAVAFDHVQPSLKTSYVMGPRVSALAPQPRQALVASCFLGRFQFETCSMSLQYISCTYGRSKSKQECTPQGCVLSDYQY